MNTQGMLAAAAEIQNRHESQLGAGDTDREGNPIDEANETNRRLAALCARRAGWAGRVSGRMGDRG